MLYYRRADYESDSFLSMQPLHFCLFLTAPEGPTLPIQTASESYPHWKDLSVTELTW